MKFTLTVEIENLTKQGFMSDAESFEDAFAALLGGMGYIGKLTQLPTGNEVHFPVEDMQPVSILENAIPRARRLAQEVMQEEGGLGSDEDNEEDYMFEEEGDDE